MIEPASNKYSLFPSTKSFSSDDFAIFGTHIIKTTCHQILDYIFSAAILSFSVTNAYEPLWTMIYLE